MQKFLKPSSILLYFLTAILFFLLGTIIAGLAGAGKNQGLAAAAIVLGYGAMTGFVAVIAAVLAVKFLKQSQIVVLNKILGAIFLLLLVYIIFRQQTRKAALDRSLKPQYKFTAHTPDAPDFQTGPGVRYRPPMGLGMATPQFYENNVVYFYGNPNLEKPVSDHAPIDSLVFQRTETGIQIAYAPPWFVPAHLKMDYELLFIRVMSVHHDFVEVMVNETNGQTAYMDRLKIKLKYWPEFLLAINSVEPLHLQNNLVRIKPLSHAGTVTIQYAFLKPLGIANQWIYVELLDDGFKPLGKGWIKWRENGKLLITYSLLS